MTINFMMRKIHIHTGSEGSVAEGGGRAANEHKLTEPRMEGNEDTMEMI